MNVEAQQRLSYVLAAICGVLLLLLLAMWMGFGRGYGWLDSDPAAAPRLPNPAQLQQLSFQMPPFDHYVEITQRPLFADDRKPIPPSDEEETAEPATPAVPLRIALTGVIVTPAVKVAMLRDLNTNKSVTLKEGMPLPGNQAGWILVEIHPRKIVVSDPEDKTTEVELTAPGANPSAPTAAAAGGRRPPRAANASPQQKAANDLRARIEARRQELREQAERLRQRQGRSDKPADETEK
ncbi:MAG TPA: hypothetical protein VFN09_00625 [Rhodanobacteraceae bacterium]|nr:hypothetical protein [Rhodanobacteraceae bacterium]